MNRRIGPVIGHRGAAGHAPENTLVSIRKAAALGVRWVEFDVRLSRDGEPVLFHDDALDRTTDGRGWVAERTLSQLRALDAGSWFGSAFAGERIPTLGEALAQIAALRLGANVEIKSDAGREVATAEAVARILKAEWPATSPPPVVSSFRPESIAAAREAAPDLIYALLVAAVPRDWRARLGALGCRDLHCSAERLTRSKAEAVAAGGNALRCYTVNTAHRARTLFQWGVEAVFTDYPERIQL